MKASGDILVLIIDDEPVLLRALERVFKKRGLRVEVADTGRNGLEKWREFRPQVVVLDVILPDMTGPDLLRKETKSLPKANVFLTSAYTGSESLNLSEWPWVKGFISKPFDDIFAVSERILSGDPP